MASSSAGPIWASKWSLSLSSNLKQQQNSCEGGDRSVADFAVDFHTRALQNHWNSIALSKDFLYSLADGRGSYGAPNQLFQAGLLWPPVMFSAPDLPRTSWNPEESSEDSSTWLSSEERLHHREQWSCMYCGQAVHFVSSCMTKG